MSADRLRQRLKRFLFPYGRPWAARQVWSIGIYQGESPLCLRTPAGLRNPVMSPSQVDDVPAMLVADPFMLRKHKTWYMFFEVMNNRTGRGEIGLAMSRDAKSWRYQQIVLAEPFHLSYPYVFEHEHELYMIPESHQARAVRLYRARNFPLEWTLDRTLLQGGYFADASVASYNGRWWMFTEAGEDFKFDKLRLFYADSVTGPWQEHPQSPIITDNPHIARPAGRLVVFNGRLIRYAQDDYPIYGRSVQAFEVVELTARRYSERPASPSLIVGPGRGWWNRLGMHHVDLHQMEDGSWVACVDGLGTERLLLSRLRRRIAGARATSQ